MIHIYYESIHGRGRQMISLCCILRNEEKNLKQFLSHYKGLADEVIIVDTGSKDKTIKTAKKFTNRIFSFRWQDDFSIARNFSIEKASKRWILWLDPDEIIDKKDFWEIRQLTEKSAFLGFRLIQETYFRNKLVSTRGICKLFRNNKGIQFSYPVHETVRQSIKASSGRIGKTGIRVKHYPELGKWKSAYYFELLEKKKKEFPESSWRKELENEVKLFKQLEIQP
ncbi:glycosyltransferase [Candidatus Woesearchaeota archaeon]|nr:glycosyltransferase [Candidatus Woesearchaeota archaeon]